jgi:hypothetical protein
VTGRRLRIIVCGSRNWHDQQRIADRLGHVPADATIVHGGARGADSIAGEEAARLGLLVEPHYANWERYGRAAGPIRNREMADAGADLCIAFLQETPDAPSRGTRNMIDQARERGIPVEVIEA